MAPGPVPFIETLLLFSPQTQPFHLPTSLLPENVQSPNMETMMSEQFFDFSNIEYDRNYNQFTAEEQQILDVNQQPTRVVLRDQVKEARF